MLCLGQKKSVISNTCAKTIINNNIKNAMIDNILKKLTNPKSLFLCDNLVKKAIEVLNVRKGINCIKKLFKKLKLPYDSGPKLLVIIIVENNIIANPVRFDKSFVKYLFFRDVGLILLIYNSNKILFKIINRISNLLCEIIKEIHTTLQWV